MDINLVRQRIDWLLAQDRLRYHFSHSPRASGQTHAALTLALEQACGGQKVAYIHCGDWEHPREMLGHMILDKRMTY